MNATCLDGIVRSMLAIAIQMAVVWILAIVISKNCFKFHLPTAFRKLGLGLFLGLGLVLRLGLVLGLGLELDLGLHIFGNFEIFMDNNENELLSSVNFFSWKITPCINAGTLCLKKRPTCKLSVTLSNLNRFSKFLHCWKAYKIRYKTNTKLPTSP